MLSSGIVEKKVFKRKLERFKRSTAKKRDANKKQYIGDDIEISDSNKEERSNLEGQDETKNVGIGEPESEESKTIFDDATAKEQPPQQMLLKSSILTDIRFSSLQGRVSETTLRAVEEMGFERMTEIQAKSIPPLLEGKDVLGSAKTGSGMAGSSISAPLMEKHPSISHGLVMGGANRQNEEKRLSSGISILVATPGRLLDHLQNTSNFLVRNLKCFIVDEADRIFDIGFEQEMHQIIKLLPKKRQSVLFSATCSAKVDELVKTALKTDPLKIGVMEPQMDPSEMATVEGLEQGYVVCPSEKRFLLLFTFLKKNRSKKIMVFFSSCASVRYHNDLLNFIDLPVMNIHGKLKQQQRTRTFFQFCQAASGTLLCTDVAARGLDIPRVDWIVQYDPPDEPREYIHRVGRTARGDTGTGHALLILRPEELGFLRFLKAAKVTLNEYEFSWSKLANIQPQLEQVISRNYYLNKSAREAYKGYVRSYDSHSLKKIYNVNTLDLIQVCKSFGFETPPFVDLPVSNKPRTKDNRTKFAGGLKGKRPKVEFVAGGIKKRKQQE
uniref:ATP-dependent RNA helicase n=1 Tax=Globodera rostochiensis TaxID=31243 RepID=A0A914HMD1_GLORO